MSGISITLQALYAGERRMERELLAVAERHRADHEVHHVAVDVARWSHDHVERIAATAQHHGLHLPDPAEDPPPDPRAQEPEHAEPGPDLLHDLRLLHLAANENSLNWETLAQTARAARDDELLDLATGCHPQTVRQMLWTNSLIKTLSPQLLGSKAGMPDPDRSWAALPPPVPPGEP
ncbi:hypothetical protein [Kitasatospora sp. NPDC047058]|uniref:hypothetical protein n=1 Tax=Kitasatospora sp. NPDC047058 TaxID=3155620 RepID=UPI0034118394